MHAIFLALKVFPERPIRQVENFCRREVAYMFHYYSNYSSAPVSPVRSSPGVWGGGTVDFVPGRRVQADEVVAGEARTRGSAPSALGVPGIINSIRLQGTSAQEREAVARDFADRQSALASERAYAEAGKQALRSGGLSVGEDKLFAFASVQSASSFPAQGGAVADARQDPVGVAEDSAESEEAGPSLAEDAAGGSAGREARSAERSYVGAPSGERRGYSTYARMAGINLPSQGGRAFSLAV